MKISSTFPLVLFWPIYCFGGSNKEQQNDIYEYTLSHDTLSIVSVSPILYDPFGKFKSMTEFENKYKDKFVRRIEFRHPYDDSAVHKETIYRMTFKNSFIKFIELYEEGLMDTTIRTLQVVSSKIFDKEIALMNGDHVGMAIDEILGNEYQGVEKPRAKINTIVGIRALDGVWIYYSFSKGKLTSIAIKTNYQFNQE